MIKVGSLKAELSRQLQERHKKRAELLKPIKNIDPLYLEKIKKIEYKIKTLEYQIQFL